MRDLLQNQFFAIQLIKTLGVVRFKRKSKRFSSLEEVAQRYQEATRIVSSLNKKDLKLLVDLREAPIRNDPGFEEIVAPLRKELFSGFSQAAILVRSAVGVLHVTRNAREDEIQAGVFQDEADAFSYLRSGARRGS